MNELDYCIEQLKRTGDREDAYHRLLECGDNDAVAFLVSKYRQESDVNIKSLLMEVIWHRQQDAEILVFLSQAIKHGDPIIWKTAIDGFVSIGGSAALKCLTRTEVQLQSERTKQEWIAEAIDQIQTENTDS